MNKLVKTLIIVNGIIFPIFVGFIFIQHIRSISPEPENEYEDTGIIVGEKLENAKKDSMVLQGLEYGSPRSIYNSTNYYLPISAHTYEEAKELKELASMAGDINITSFRIMNVVFLDKDFNTIGTLLDKKASIKDIDVPYEYYNKNEKVDKTVNNIIYLIGFEDTNQNGLLDSEDYHDLYITDLNGKNLTQVTNDINIESYRFVKSHTQLLIRYKERNDLREEHKRAKFSIFDIKKSEFKFLSDIDKTMDELEKILIL